MLGLPYLRNLLRAPTEAKIQILIANAQYIPEMLGEALSERRKSNSIYQQAPMTPNSSGKNRQYEENLSEHNEAWRWAFRDESFSYRHGNKALRTYGYVFWDKTRLGASGILKRE